MPPPWPLVDTWWPTGSTLAYQGYGRGVDLEALRSATDLAIGDCRPDKIILIDIDVDTANERRARNHEDRFESADVDFHQRLRTGYLTMAEENPDVWVVLDGRPSFDDVAAAIDAVVRPLL